MPTRILSQPISSQSSSDLPEGKTPPATVQKSRVLMVEGDQPTIELYRRILTQEYEVIACGDEAGVLETLSSGNLCAIILEPALCAGKGWAIYSAIRRSAQGEHIPVIMCSTLDERKRGFEMGAAAFLVKPVLPAALVETIRQVRRSGLAG